MLHKRETRLFGMLTRARAFSTEALKVINNVAKQQFVVTLRSAEATIEYDKKGNEIIFKTTNVPKDFQGKGVGKLLARYAFDYALDHKYNVTCKCHFLAKYYQDNLNQYKGIDVKLMLD